MHALMTCIPRIARQISNVLCSLACHHTRITSAAPLSPGEASVIELLVCTAQAMTMSSVALGLSDA